MFEAQSEYITTEGSDSASRKDEDYSGREHATMEANKRETAFELKRTSVTKVYKKKPKIHAKDEHNEFAKKTIQEKQQIMQKKYKERYQTRFESRS